MIGAIVDKQCVRFSIDTEFSVRNTVAESADRGSEVRMPLQITVYRREARVNVGSDTVAVRYIDRNENSTEIHHRDGVTVRVGKAVEGDQFT